MIAFSCGNCGQTLQINDSLAGKRCKCPRCSQPVLAPGKPSEIPTIPPTAAPASVRTSSVSTQDTQAGTGDHHSAGSAEAVSILAPPRKPGELGRLGPYRVLKVLGQGGMGVVYKAEDPHLERPVALKAMLPGFGASANARERFLREARAAAAIKHDHVVTIYQVGEDRGIPFLAMEFLEGEPLDQRLYREGALPIDEVLRIGREVAEGLAAAHEKGLIHRDIKPANIWLEGARGRVKLLDFGLARGGKGQEQLTQTGAIMGTPAYMAPEQARGEKVDARCDLFSLGCVLHHLCTGELPFKGNDPISTLVSVATVTPPPPDALNPAVPHGLARLVERLLDKTAARRPASAKAVAEELAALQRTDITRSATVAARTPDGAGPTRRKKPQPTLRQPAAARSWLPFALAGAVVALIAGALLVAVIVIRIKNKDGSVTTIVPPKGSTVEVEKDGTKVAIIPGEAQPANDFFNGKDLTGWEGLSGYWSVKDGSIVGVPPPGRPAHTFLCSKKKYRDFDLKFEVRRTDGVGNSGVQFRSQLKDRTGFRVIGPQCEIDSSSFAWPPGSLLTEPNAKPLAVKAPQAEIAKRYKDDDFNAFHIRCVGKHVTIKVNGVTAIDDDYPELPDEGIIAWQLHGSKSPKEVTFRKIEFTDLGAPTAQGWESLFNGKDLKGWKVFPRGEGNWRVEDGAITCKGPSSHLFSERGDYDDFHIRVEAMINERGNSGLYFRTGFAGGFPKGYEAQIALSGGDGRARTGSLYNIRNLLDELHKPDEWFILEVIAKGDRIIIKVNGRSVVDQQDKTYRRGHFALQHNTASGRPTVVKFRKIEIKELTGKP